jgi:hypothetical protein
VAISGSRIEVVWVSKRNGASVILAAASADSGATFAPARLLTPDGASGARGWQNAAFAADGTVHAVWLDGRNDHAEHHTGGAMRQDLYHAAWRADGPVVETAVAANVCFCCKTALIARGSEVYVAWRHLFPGGVRDIALTRSPDGGRTFSEPVRVSADNWQIDACPDDGPAIAMDTAGTLHVAWPTMVETARGPRIGIFAATSTDHGASFSPRVRVDTGEGGAAHPKLALTADGRPVIVWDELFGGARRIRARVGTDLPLTVSDGRIGIYPAVAVTGESVLMAWTDQSDKDAVIRTLRLPHDRP